MHNNYYFLRQLSIAFQDKLVGSVISESFTQSKDELIIRFETTDKPFFVKVNVSPALSCLSFPEKLERARKNSVDLFEGLVGQRVLRIRQFKNERSLALILTNDLTLLFKMHGNRSNVILLEKETVINQFQQSILSDATISLDELDRDIDFSYEGFKQNISKLSSLYFTFGKVVWQYLESKNFSQQSIEDKWTLIQHVISELERPEYLITEIKSQIHLSLLPVGTTLKQKNNPIDAANEFFYSFTNLSARAVEKNKLSSQLDSKIQANKNYITKNKGKLDELQATHSYKAWADLIMANLHSIPPNSKRVELNNFYNDNIPTEIKLRPELTPQKNAEAYYRKSKNQQIEIDKLNEGIRSKEKEILALENQLAEIEQTDDLKKLKNFSSEFLAKQVDKKTSPLPYREYVYKNYKIWVGRDAQRNDELTLKFSFKEDLWLHAKDVSGSHVLIKHQAGKNFPKDVIEYAAQLAAFHSKRKTETLCPVAYTPKKFVRKRKGDPAGLVVVEREEVIMVEPLKPTL